MKILFIETPFVFFPRLAGVYFPNPGPITIAAYLERYGYDIEIIDMLALGIKWANIASLIKKKKPHVVGISGITKNSYMCMVLAELVKEIDSGIITVLGGVHFSLNPEESLRICRDIDYIVVGEGELTLLELVKAIEQGKKKQDMYEIKGLAYLEGDHYIQTDSRSFIEDLDSLPFPAYHLLPMDKYALPHVGKNGFGCSFSRGCFFKCRFCSERVLWKNRWRGRSGRKIVEELELLVKEFGRKSFWIGDANFMTSRKRNIEFLEEMEKRNLDITFKIETRASDIIRDNDLLERFRKIGLSIVMVGVESYNQNKLDKLDKRQRIADIEGMSKYLHEARIPILMTCLIWGDYDDNKKAISSLLEGSKRIKGCFLAHNLITPFPGTELFDEMKRKNRIKVWDYRKYDFDHAIMPTRYLSIWELEKLSALAFFRWWFNPKIIFRNIFNHRRRRLQFYQFKIAIIVGKYLLITGLFKKKFDSYELMIDKMYRRHLDYLEKEESNIKSFKVWKK